VCETWRWRGGAARRALRQRTLQSDCSHRKTRPFGIIESSCGRCGLVESPQPPERNTKHSPHSIPTPSSRLFDGVLACGIHRQLAGWPRSAGRFPIRCSNHELSYWPELASLPLSTDLTWRARRRKPEFPTLGSGTQSRCAWGERGVNATADLALAGQGQICCINRS
jgi:hypothetical protein